MINDLTRVFNWTSECVFYSNDPSNIFRDDILKKKVSDRRSEQKKKNETVDEGAAIFITVAFDKLDEERKEYNNNKRKRNAH